MDITLTNELVDAVGAVKLKPYGVDPDKQRWHETNVDLMRYGNKQVRHLRDLLAPHGKVKGARRALADLAVWIDAAERGSDAVKCKKTEHFASLAFEWLQGLPRPWLYKKDPDRDCWVAFYVGGIHFKPKVTMRDGVAPAYTTIRFYNVELGVREAIDRSWHDSDVRGLTAPEALRETGFVPETPELKAAYEADVERYVECHDKLGRQFFAHGVGTSNLDGNPGRDDDSRWYWRGVDTVHMVRNGEPSRVVIDVFRESDKKDQDRDDHLDADFWRRRSFLKSEDDDALDDVRPGDEDDDAPHPPPDVPLFPVVPVFDLRRHLRLRVHVGNLVEYRYDASLGDKLVLPDAQRRLVNMLVAHKGGFNDIVKGKGGGAVILAAGPPGTGKTLTAEVYAETEGRALYSVQCSQLGTDPDTLEKSLLQVFVRAQRWNAILLLDEADVYVARRGSDLVQNAIVGVFLRVLEYYNGVLFLTTNRAELVDDAIASRCVARIPYTNPDPEGLFRIWRVLAEAMGVDLPDAVLVRVVEDHPNLSGRDVKNLLKLAVLVTRTTGEPVTAKLISFVKQFKPTEGGE